MKNDSEMLIKYTIRLEAKNVELEKKLEIAVEALELITKIAYYLDYKDHKMFARETLKKIKQ